MSGFFVGDNMVLKNVEIIAALIAVVFGIFLVFEARAIVRKYNKNKNENSVVRVCKIVGSVIAIGAMYIIYMLKYMN